MRHATQRRLARAARFIAWYLLLVASLLLLRAYARSQLGDTLALPRALLHYIRTGEAS